MSTIPSDQKVTQLPSSQEIENICDEIIKGEYNLIPKLQSYLIGDLSVNKIILNKNVCRYLISIIPTVNDEIISNSLILFVNFIGEKNSQTFSLHLVENGLFHLFDKFFEKSFDVLYSFMFLLGNMFSDGLTFVEMAMKNNLLEKINRMMNYIGMKFETIRNVFKLHEIQIDENDNLWKIVNEMHLNNVSSFIYVITFVYSNITRRRYILQTSNDMSIVNHFQSILCSPDDNMFSNEIISDALRGMVFLLDSEQFSVVDMNDKLIERLFQLMLNSDYQISQPSIRIIGHFVSMDEDYVEKFVRKGLLKAFEYLLHIAPTQKQFPYFELFWTISNVAASDNPLFSNMIVEETNIVTMLCDMYESNTFEAKILIEIMYSLLNLLYYANNKKFIKILTKNSRIIRIIIHSMLEFKDNERLISLSLKAIVNFIQFGNDIGINFKDILKKFDELMTFFSIYDVNSLSGFIKGRFMFILQYLNDENEE